MLRAQFTYTASRRPGRYDASAGWKVLDVVPDDSVPEEIVRRAARNVGGFVPPALPELASKADVDSLPHCLRLDVLDGGERLVCLSSIVAAGPDYSGRPNTFAHGLLLSPDAVQVDGTSSLRPADLWDAPLWLRPLGTKATEDSAPDEDLHALTRGPLDDVALEAFTKAHPNQRELVLAAIERYLCGGAGPLVVVGDASFSSVATWLHLAGRLLLPASAWRLPFSTYERLRDARTANNWQFAAVGVPAADAAAAAALPGSRFTVLRDEEQPVRAGLGRWTLHDGTELMADSWAQLAESVITNEFLPVVADQVNALASRVGDTTLDQPLWALGAAVLLDEDLAEFFGSEAAEVAAAHWPARLESEELLEQVLEGVERYGEPDVAADLRERVVSDPDSPIAQRALLRPVLAALETPADFERLAHTLPQRPIEVAPTLRTDLSDAVADALGRVPQADDPVGALLAVAAVMDSVASPLELRLRAVELARELVVPRLVEPAADPVRRGWPPVPSWLWDSLTPALAATPQLEHGIELPGENLSAATHEWLGSLSLPTGELTAEALRRTGPVEWERASYRLFVQRADVTPLERAAAFLRTVYCAAVNEGTGMDRWAGRAVDEAYKRPPLDLPTALVLMDVLSPDVAFAGPLAGVLQRTPVASSGTRAAVEQLYERETVPSTLEKLLERHRRFEEAAATPVSDISEPKGLASAQVTLTEVQPSSGDALVTASTQLDSLLRMAATAPSRSTWALVTEAVLRVHVRVLPMQGLPSSLWKETTPWGDGWARLNAKETDPGLRTQLAANLLCRGARAHWWPRDDWAAGWLTDKGEQRSTVWAQTIAEQLLLRGDSRIDVVALVRVLTEQTQRKPRVASPDSEQREDAWRAMALSWAEQLAGSKPRPSPVPRTR
ncbi:hypothetical protein ACI798_02285 [Geodermatophilus sp. SYSU D01045]